jgi:GntR family transcriptional regulator / MocR family aminotransferase
VEIRGGNAGSHLAVWLPRLPVDRVEELIARCKSRDVGVYSIASHAALPLEHGGLMLGYALIDVESIEEGVKILAEEYRELSTTCSAGL